ncbi:NUDIX domain-containing protein [Edaphobacillus lindanitolerans]|uniref:ADP-ribose pyrophosphatase n=1 Tax=Edaphobacillus lindanitolerans TaxID=550447 RepID=A0A1U7PIT1_9BACI|nr:NUDIX hydrolase [Edaphobacillus lindanitolerans]SIT66833.1 ADP-ribose pyrophosphatase [Edaphobacillus lindanitolerans]
MEKFEERTVSTKTIYEGKIITVELDDVILPDGKPAKRELVRHPGAVAIVPLLEDGRIVLVEQYRKALGKSMIEVPAGKLEPGEAPAVTARRELEEETGYACAELVHITTFATSPGFADEVVHMFAARGLTRIEEPAAGDEDEFVELHEATLEEAEAMMEDGRIFDAKTAFSLLWAKGQKTGR